MDVIFKVIAQIWVV